MEPTEITSADLFLYIFTGCMALVAIFVVSMVFRGMSRPWPPIDDETEDEYRGGWTPEEAAKSPVSLAEALEQRERERRESRNREAARLRDLDDRDAERRREARHAKQQTSLYGSEMPGVDGAMHGEQID